MMKGFSSTISQILPGAMVIMVGKLEWVVQAFLREHKRLVVFVLRSICHPIKT